MDDFSWLSAPIATVRGIGEWHRRRLGALGIQTVWDLLRHFPSRYDDFSNIKTIAELKIGELATIAATVKKISVRRTWKRHMLLTEALLEDGTGAIRAVWFNQPYLRKNIPQGSRVSVAGKLVKDEHGLYLSNPAYEVVGRGVAPRHTAGLVPVYPETRGITSRMLRAWIQPLLPHATKLPDPLPADLRARNRLPDFSTALRDIHFPPSVERARAARRRFAFEEIFLSQLLFQKIKAAMQTLRAPAIPADIPLIKKFVASLPFPLTDAQRRSAWEILQDTAKPYPMNRLLNGDVGSGKTIVGAIAALNAAAAGYQVAILAPTEILARQHFKKISELFATFPIKTALLVSGEARTSTEGFAGSVRPETLRQELAGGNPIVAIGTHAILEKNVRFGKLGLVVVDEQHRFGVEQRAALTKNHATTPHLLSMSATPIPRTLALGLYGDLDISILDELPRGRKKIITKIISPVGKVRAHEFIRKEIERGRQAFVICPRIDPETHSPEEDFEGESEDWRVEVRAVTTEFKKLSEEIFPNLRVAMLHGRMLPREKERIMADFAAGTIQILVSTSVVEVGVDVPNATVMMVEGAEHFGLAQLHQFRGRVGRGSHQSYCLLFTESKHRTAKKRLEALAELDDGFKLAEKDLELRGPGQFFGTKQSGLPDLAMRSLTDLPLVELARREARSLLQKDPALTNAPLLKTRLEEFRRKVHLE
jgi:ATP-dependent DNA helicase RecG